MAPATKYLISGIENLRKFQQTRRKDFNYLLLMRAITKPDFVQQIHKKIKVQFDSIYPKQTALMFNHMIQHLDEITSDDPRLLQLPCFEHLNQVTNFYQSMDLYKALYVTSFDSSSNDVYFILKFDPFVCHDFAGQERKFTGTSYIFKTYFPRVRIKQDNLEKHFRILENNQQYLKVELSLTFSIQISGVFETQYSISENGSYEKAFKRGEIEYGGNKRNVEIKVILLLDKTKLPRA